MNTIKNSFILLSSLIIPCSNEKIIKKRPNIIWLATKDLVLHIPTFGDSTISTPNLN
tara:strand:- start:101 stop:271 length:171 start_codon:yes stop_codon:yes gene_type:complete